MSPSRFALSASMCLLAGCASSHAARHEQPPSPAPVGAAAGAPATVAETTPEPKPVAQNPFDYGTTQPVRPDTNAQTASVGTALQHHDHPERLSPLIAPKPFDLAAYRRDPQAYLDVVEPGRVFQVAQPGPGVPRIQAMGPAQATIAQGGQTVLQAHVVPGMPVSFTSFDLGRFAENQLTAITVAANDQGIAQVTFLGASGTIGEVNILAACPVTAGQLTYHIDVTRN